MFKLTSQGLPIQCVDKSHLKTDSGIITNEGGTINGNVTFSNPIGGIFRNDNKDVLTITSGPSWDNTPSISLYGAELNDTSLAGSFIIRTKDPLQNITGQSNGSLMWNGKEIERISLSSYGFIRYDSGIQICWSDGVTTENCGTHVSFPAPFKDEYYCLTSNISGDQNAGGVNWTVLVGTRLTTGCNLWAFRNGTLWSGVYLFWIAIGHWK